MKKRILHVFFLLLPALPFLSFHSRNPDNDPKQTCYNFVRVIATGLTINHVTIKAGGQTVIDVSTNITSGTYQDFQDGFFTTGASINVGVNIYGQSAAPRMGSLSISNPDNCQLYTNATQGNITGTKLCSTLFVTAQHAMGCP